MIFIVLQILVDRLNSGPECNWLAKSFSFYGMSDDWFIASHVMDVKFNTFDAFFEVFDVSADFAIARYLISC